ncbi:T9SS type A sorting domain-containing protein [Salibacteraceae bacterium]|jgi:ligand-binding sensor domain-containing protein|nr:T9SS type A sorting domain-containing protein [Salibacteraceae bacterium]
MKFLLLISSFLLIGLSSQSQWTAYTTSSSDLPDNSVQDIAIDSSNVLWVATQQGLGKFDSTNWTVYVDTNSGIPELSYNTCYSVFVDKDEFVWLGMDDGYLVKFDQDTTWTDYSTEGFGEVYAINQDADGEIWVGHSFGLKSFDGTTWTDHNPGIHSDFVEVIEFDQYKNVWCGTKDGLAKRDSNGVWTSYDRNNSGITSNDWVEALHRGLDDSLWVGTRGGACHFDTDTTWRIYTSSNSGLWEDEIRGLDVAADSTVWAANDGASIAKFKAGVWTKINLPFNFSFADEILIDHNGVKWVATQSGLAKYEDGGAGPMLFLPTVISNGLPEFTSESLKFYPNPSTGNISIQNENSMTIKVIDGRGRLLFSSEVGAFAELNLDLKPGLYHIEAIDADGSFFQSKLVIQ